MKPIQLTSADEIRKLRDYNILQIEKMVLNTGEDEGYCLGLLQVKDSVLQTEATTEIVFEEEKRTDDVINSLIRLFSDSVILAEPSSVVYLRSILEKQNFDSTIRYIPASKLFVSVFPDLPAEKSKDAAELADFFQLEIPQSESILQWPYTAFSVFSLCQMTLSGDAPLEVSSSAQSSTDEGIKEKKRSSPRYTDRQLQNAARKIWAISPWTVLAVFVFLFIAAAVLIPKDTTSPTDRTKAPNSYLVLSWDENGRYGTKSRLTDTVEFRIPYGVYNVLNNNSIPVEVTVIDEGTVLIAQDIKNADSDEPISVTADNLSVGSDDTETEKRKQHITEITIRPNTSREITVDEDQYMTLSEDANELIFFYLHEVPEETSDITTGQVNQTQAIVYAYVKGTDVRFRSSPSLEGHIINTLQNGQQVQVLGITGEWTHVKVQDQNGYIFSQYISSEEQEG